MANALVWAAKKPTGIKTLAHMTGTRRILKKIFGLYVGKSPKMALFERYDLVVSTAICSRLGFAASDGRALSDGRADCFC